MTLYHGLGSGKTITSIAIANHQKGPVIVVAPASMRTQWASELKKMNVDTKRYHVVSYEGFVAKPIHDIEKTTIIVDEAHRLRDLTGKIAKYSVAVLKNAKQVLLLTGTPMVNTPVDFSPLVNAIAGKDVLPTNEKTFRSKFYMQPTMKAPPPKQRCAQYSAITCSENGKATVNHLCKYHQYLYLKRCKNKTIRRRYAFTRDREYEIQQANRIEQARLLEKAVQLTPDLAKYRTYVKDMVSYYRPKPNADFPSVTVKRFVVRMSPAQNALYLKAKKKISKTEISLMSRGQDFTKSPTFNAFLNATRQVSNTSKGNTDTPKLQNMLQYIRTHPKPVIVYSNWLENGIRPMKELLQKTTMTPLEFTGAMTDVQKQDVVQQYNSGNIDVLLLSSSGGEGLDLKNTRQIHIMEPHWNTAKIQQVIGRGIRYKSHESLPVAQRKVEVCYWISKPLGTSNEIGTDEYLYQMSERKTDEMRAFLQVLQDECIEKK